MNYIYTVLHFVLVDCGDLGAPVSGNRTFAVTLERSIVTYACDTGFEVVGNHTQTEHVKWHPMVCIMEFY